MKIARQRTCPSSYLDRNIKIQGFYTVQGWFQGHHLPWWCDRNVTCARGSSSKVKTMKENQWERLSIDDDGFTSRRETTVKKCTKKCVTCKATLNLLLFAFLFAVVDVAYRKWSIKRPGDYFIFSCHRCVLIRERRLFQLRVKRWG